MQLNKIINEAKNIIVRKFSPEKIILFGSCANNEFKTDSDIDLFIIKNTSKNDIRKLRLQIKKELREIIFKFNVAFDIFLDTPEGVEKRIKEFNDQFYKEIVFNGKIIYEK